MGTLHDIDCASLWRWHTVAKNLPLNKREKALCCDGVGLWPRRFSGTSNPDESEHTREGVTHASRCTCPLCTTTYPGGLGTRRGTVRGAGTKCRGRWTLSTLWLWGHPAAVSPASVGPGCTMAVHGCSGSRSPASLSMDGSLWLRP